MSSIITTTEDSISERPILFRAPVVQALLAGRKTQTRRIVKFPAWAEPEFELEENGTSEIFAISKATGCLTPIPCPYGKPGDRLWVREAWRTLQGADDIAPRDLMNVEAYTHYEADKGSTKGIGKLRPSIFMPRWASRITLEITEVRVQRLRECTEDDATAEGMLFVPDDKIRHTGWRHSNDHGYVYDSALAAYHVCWEKINGQGSWQNDPWVWAVSFKVVNL